MKLNKKTLLTSALFFFSGYMLIAGNIYSPLGLLFYPGVFLISFLISKGHVHRPYFYFLLAPYFLMLGVFVWNEVFPYYSGIVLAILSGELFARILSLFLSKYRDKSASVLIFPAFLFMFEFVFLNIPGANTIHMIPFMAPLSTHSVVMGAVSFFGGRLILFLITLSLSAASKILAGSRNFKLYGTIFLAGVVFVTLPNFFDVSGTSTNAREITVACIQGSYTGTGSVQTNDPYEKRFRYYMDLAEGERADITVFPEIALGLYDTKNKIDEKYRENIMEAAEKSGGAVLIVFTEGNSDTKSKEERYIAAILANSDGILGITRKRNLVPFSETAKYSKGDSYEVFELNKVKAGVSICYDINVKTVEKLKRNGSEVILAPFNDAGFGLIYHNIHRSFSIIKASECAVPIIVANEDGISQIIDHKGRILAELGFGEKGRITRNVLIYDHRSVYMTAGIWLETSAFIVLAVLTVGSVTHSLMRKLRKNATY